MIIKDNQFVKFTYDKCKKLKENENICLKTFKQDRYLKITKQDNKYYLEEVGYECNNIIVEDLKELLKYIKIIHKREFPRSNNIRVSIKK